MSRKTTTCVECHGPMQMPRGVTELFGDARYCDSCFFRPDVAARVRRVRFKARKESHVNRG